MTRLEANREIVKKLSEFIEIVPDWRFGQILNNIWNVSYVDVFYRESTEMMNVLNTVIPKYEEDFSKEE